MVVDFCAGAGGKTLALGALMRNTGRLYAFDVSAKRLAGLDPRLARSGLSNVHPIVISTENDLRAKRLAGKIDRVLVDAPCTGLGALRRRPEARWRRTAADLVELSSLQRALLVSAIEATRSGGIIGYATCSPHLAETRFVVSDVAKKRKDVEIVDARDLFADTDGRQVEQLGEGPFVQLWPHIHGTDAMFFALLRKK